jgi:hypothetical protein
VIHAFPELGHAITSHRCPALDDLHDGILAEPDVAAEPVAQPFILNASWPRQTNADPGLAARGRARQQAPSKTICSIRWNCSAPLDRQHEFAIVRWSNANIFSAYPREHILGKSDHQLADAAGILPVVNPRQSWARAQP